MKSIKNHLLILLVLCLSSIPFSSNAQYGYFGEISYKLGRTGLSNAYATWTPVSEGAFEHELNFYSDGFLQKNFQMYFGNRSENIYYRGKVDGLFYGMAMLFNYENKTGPLKSRYWGYQKVEEENPTIVESIPTPYYSTFAHPISGAGDYQFLNFDLAFGSDELKIGLHWAAGFLGAGGGANGNPVNPLNIRNMGATSANLGYHQYGIKAHLFSEASIPVRAKAGLHRISSLSNNFDKRHGFGIDLEAKAFLKDGPFSPFLGGYFEFKRLGSMKEDLILCISNGNGCVNYQVPGLSSVALGFTLGIMVSQE